MAKSSIQLISIDFPIDAVSKSVNTLGCLTIEGGKMSLLGVLRNKPAVLTSNVLSQRYRNFNLGPFGKSEVSIWLEVTPSENSDSKNLFTLRIKNEGNAPLSNLELFVKTSSEIQLINRGEVFGTSKNPEVITHLPAKKSICYSTAVKINSFENSPSIQISLSKTSGKNFMEVLQATLNLSQELSQLGA